MTRPCQSLVLDGGVIKVRLEANRISSGELVAVDWIRFTTRPRFVPKLMVPEKSKFAGIWEPETRMHNIISILNTLPDADRDLCSQASLVVRMVCLVLGPDFSPAVALAKGHDFYKHRWQILRNGCEVGWVGFGASGQSPRQAKQAETKATFEMAASRDDSAKLTLVEIRPTDKVKQAA